MEELPNKPNDGFGALSDEAAEVLFVEGAELRKPNDGLFASLDVLIGFD